MFNKHLNVRLLLTNSPKDGRFLCFTLPENHVFSSNSAFELHFQEKDEKFLLFVHSTILGECFFGGLDGVKS